MKKVVTASVFLLISFLLTGCDQTHSIPDNFYKDKNWTVWKSEDNGVAIYVASSYGAKNGIWISSNNGNNEKYLVDMDSYLGISGLNRPWEIKLTDTTDNALQTRYKCKRIKNEKDSSSKTFAIESESGDVILKSYDWKEEDIDINYLKSIGSEEYNLYCTVDVDPANYEKGYCLKGSYLDDEFLIKGELGQTFLMSYKNLEATGHYSRKENKLDFKFDTNEIFESLEHLEFNC